MLPKLMLFPFVFFWGIFYQISKIQCFNSVSPAKYDFLILGAGSGGLAAAQKAASHGAKVAIIESSEVGGTCVHRGCIPKKLFYNAADLFSLIPNLPQYALNLPGCPSFCWEAFQEKLNEYLNQLEMHYKKRLEMAHINYFKGKAKFINSKNVEVNGIQRITADNILIAVGGRPRRLNIPGREYCITSDEFFKLQKQPKNIAIIGGGYIAVELASTMQALGSQVNLYLRKEELLSGFDAMLQKAARNYLESAGCRIYSGTEAEKVLASNNKLSLLTKCGKVHKDLDSVLFATGRTPSTSDLNLNCTNVQTNTSGHILVNSSKCTHESGIYAIGDVTEATQLTPAAIRDGRNLADRLFGKSETLPDTSLPNVIPTVVFCHPPLATVGLTEKQAALEYGAHNIQVYKNNFLDLFHGFFNKIDKIAAPKTNMKIVCHLQTSKILGIHMAGPKVDEILQGFAVTLNMNVTKQLLDKTLAIHPTSAEELVTMK